MVKVWNIGNTTVRNPKRIEYALKVFVDEGFSGNVKGSDREETLHSKLKERGVLDYEGNPSDWNGRKWRAAFYQLGFISGQKYKIQDQTYTINHIFNLLQHPNVEYPYQLTFTGQKLINTESLPEIEEIYTRQFICHELPNALEKGFPSGKLKPFILLLQVLKKLHDQGLKGLDKDETGFFIQPFRNHDDNLPNTIINEIKNYRAGLAKCKKDQEKKKYRKKYIEELGNYSGINPQSIVRDYSDTTFRYYSLSGLISKQRNRISLRPNKIEFVKELLKNEPDFIYSKKPIQYFHHFYNNTYPIPIDKKSFAINDIKSLMGIIPDTKNELYKEAKKVDEAYDLEQLQDIRYKLIEYDRLEKEEDFAKRQNKEDEIKDIIRYLKTLNNEKVDPQPEIDDKPAFLEWAVWRSFLAINEIVSKVSKTRRFPIDEDFMPRNTAPGGGADIVFEFNNFILIVEVTLTTSHRQMAVESEPVRRHTAKYMEEYPDKDLYCLFVAPNVDNNVVESFRAGVWYDGDQERFINIVPMTLSDFNKTIEAFLRSNYRNTDYKTLLEKCLVYRNVPAPQWKKIISSEIDSWVNKLEEMTN